MEDNINSLIEYYTEKKLKGFDLSNLHRKKTERI